MCRGVPGVCGVRGVKGRPAMMSLCLGVTATLLASASRCLGVEGVRANFSGNSASDFFGEFSFVAVRGIREPGAPCFAGVVAAFLPRFADGSSGSSTSIASTSRTFCFFGVTNGFSFSASSRITNWVPRFERVVTFDCESADRVRIVLAEEPRLERRSRLPEASAFAELRVLFPRTVGAIVSELREGGMGGVVCGKYGDL